MKDSVYEVEAEVERTHWWFVGRRSIFKKQLARHSISSGGRILDIGTGTGSNLRLLQELGFENYVGLDARENAIHYCAVKGFGRIVKGDACALPFPSASFDFVLATDVIEHIEDDGLALTEIARILKPGGKVLITVPTFRSLWGVHDDLSEHKRRYRLNELKRLTENSNLKVVNAFYFNFLLFFPIWIVRKIIRSRNIKIRSENEINTPAVNRLLTIIFDIDTKLAPKIPIPFGVSALCVCMPRDRDLESREEIPGAQPV